MYQVFCKNLTTGTESSGMMSSNIKELQDWVDFINTAHVRANFGKKFYEWTVRKLP